MATGTAGTAARATHLQVVHFIRRGITFADRATTVVVGILPAGAVIVPAISGVYVGEVFNAGTNNRLDIGASTDSGTNNYATLLTLLGIGYITLDEMTTASPVLTADTTVSAYVDVTGSTPTTGQAEIVIAYIPDNDG